MILVDTGPLVALFDPKDSHHLCCRTVLQTIKAPLISTVPVLTEAFHILSPASKGSQNLSAFIYRGGLAIRFLDKETLQLALELMEIYRDCPMDLADASLLATAQSLKVQRIFTIDRKDFAVYRIRIGHRYENFEVINCT